MLRRMRPVERKEPEPDYGKYSEPTERDRAKSKYTNMCIYIYIYNLTHSCVFHRENGGTLGMVPRQ